ncbi:glycosyl transferase family 1 [Methanobacterium sp. A39]|uniref:Glycosyl transferase family 1 n=2 Tax=Methanobacteriaceae TaxID=2159 RepID=A0A2A2H5A4_METBR|nr:glycosyl transferase family 1 [Methanobacterium sp. A39]PAV04572.1 glycosyl transferase family 1 [Methanobacterium bryantii]
MREISKHGHEVYILAPYTGGKTEYTLESVHVERFHYFYPKRFQNLCGRSGMVDNVKEGFLVKFQVLTFLLFNIIHSLRNLNNMDIVHVQWPIPNGLGALFLKKIYGIPYINTVHGEEVYLSKRYHALFALKWFVNNSTKTVANSSATLNSCLKNGLEKEKLNIIPFGVDINFYKPLKIPKDENMFQILAVGYLIERKGFEYLIRAVKEVLNKHKDVRLTIVGSGPLEEKLKSLITELKLENNAKIMKNVSDEELLQLYNSSDLFVLPSIVDSQGNTEGLGVVLLEAMACKLPVIGSNTGGIPDIIQHSETGLLVPEKDVSQLSEAILNLIENKDLRDKLAVNGYNQVRENFNWKEISKSYLKVYNSI